MAVQFTFQNRQLFIAGTGTYHPPIPRYFHHLLQTSEALQKICELQYFFLWLKYVTDNSFSLLNSLEAHLLKWFVFSSTHYHAILPRAQRWSSNLVCQIFIFIWYCIPLCILFINYLKYQNLFIEERKKHTNTNQIRKSWILWLKQSASHIAFHNNGPPR